MEDSLTKITAALRALAGSAARIIEDDNKPTLVHMRQLNLDRQAAVAALDELDEPQPAPHEIKKVLVLSTAHLRYETSVDLDQAGNEDHWGHPIHYGYFMWANPEAELPEEVKLAVALARRLGCDYLKFDRDGDTYDELPTFKW